MNKYRLLARITFGILILGFCTCLYAQNFSSLEERMTFNEFKGAGLDKLSTDELNILNDWIRRHSLGAEEAVAISSNANSNSSNPNTFPERIGFKDYTGNDRVIEAVIVGTFQGWSGETKFILNNGMIWQQAEEDLVGVRPRENQAVTIEPGFLSSWKLSVPGLNRKLKVKRIE